MLDKQDLLNNNEEQEHQVEEASKKEELSKSKSAVKYELQQYLVKFKEKIANKNSPEDIDENLDKAFEKSEINPATKPDASASGIYKTTNPHLNGRPIAVQERAIQIEKEMKATIEASDKDPNPIASMFGKAMKNIMKREA